MSNYPQPMVTISLQEYNDMLKASSVPKVDDNAYKSALEYMVNSINGTSQSLMSLSEGGLFHRALVNNGLVLTYNGNNYSVNPK